MKCFEEQPRLKIARRFRVLGPRVGQRGRSLSASAVLWDRGPAPGNKSAGSERGDRPAI